MTTVLDYSILTNFSIIFIFLAIFIAGWGLLIKIDFFKLGSEGKKLYSVMAFALAFLVIMSPGAVQIFSFAIPWFTILLFIAFFMLFFAMVFNPDLDTGWLMNQGVVYGFLITFTVIIMLFAFANAFGQDLLEAQPGVSGAEQVEGPSDEFVPVDDVDQPRASASGSGGPAPADRDLGSNIILTLFHPKILGMLFVFLLATVTMLLIAR